MSAVKPDLRCRECGKSVAPELAACPHCGTLVQDTLTEEKTMHGHRGYDTPELTALPNRHSVTLEPRQIALYIEDASIPLIVDLSERVTLGRRSIRDTKVSPSISLNNFDAFNRGISRIHVTLYYDESSGMLMLIDEYSTNGTWINGQRVEPMYPTVLPSGSELRLSRLRMLVVAAPSFPPVSQTSSTAN